MGNKIFLLILVAGLCWMAFAYGFNKGLSAGLTTNNNEMTWDCKFNNTTGFAVCNGNKK